MNIFVNYAYKKFHAIPYECFEGILLVEVKVYTIILSSHPWYAKR